MSELIELEKDLHKYLIKHKSGLNLIVNKKDDKYWFDCFIEAEKGYNLLFSCENTRDSIHDSVNDVNTKMTLNYQMIDWIFKNILMFHYKQTGLVSSEHIPKWAR